MTILPAIFPRSAREARDRIRAVQNATAWIQFDVADGTLVKNKSWQNAKDVSVWKIKPNLELHLMVNDPWRVIRSWRSVVNFKRALWHIEAPIDHKKLIDRCRRAGLQVGLAINPETRVLRVAPFIRDLDEVLIMGVHPGESGQRLMPKMLIKIDAVRRLSKTIAIGWDGGVTAKNIGRLAKRGVSRFAVTNAIFKTRDGGPETALKTLRRTIKA